MAAPSNPNALLMYDIAYWAAALAYDLDMGGNGKYPARRLRLARRKAGYAGLDPNGPRDQAVPAAPAAGPDHDASQAP